MDQAPQVSHLEVAVGITLLRANVNKGCLLAALLAIN